MPERQSLIRGIVVLTACSAVTLGAASAQARRDRIESPLGGTANHPLPELIKKVQSGVVYVETHTCNGYFVGTGMLLGPRRIATVEHVVDGAATILIKRNQKVLATATVIGSDAARDVALLMTSKPIKGYQFKLATRAAQIGDEVEVLGYPLAGPFTGTRGSVSSLDNTVNVSGVSRRALIKTDARVNGGNSGGPMMLIESGKVIGLIDARLYGADGFAWAVSARVARPLLSAWGNSPQQIPLASCDPAAALKSYAQRVSAILELSQSGRGNAGAVVKQVAKKTATFEDGAAQMRGPIANRQEVLREIKSLPPAPPGADHIPTQLADAIQASLDADVAYRTWMQKLANDQTGQASVKNDDFDRAQNLSIAASREKTAFTKLYNPLAQRFGLAQWSATAF